MFYYDIKHALFLVFFYLQVNVLTSMTLTLQRT